MTRFLTLATMVGLLCLPIESEAQYQIIELADVQLVKSLSAVVQDPSGSPLTDVLVQEFSPDWKTYGQAQQTTTEGLPLPAYKVERFTVCNFRRPALTRSVYASR